MSKSGAFTIRTMLFLRNDHVQKSAGNRCFSEPFTGGDVCLRKRKFALGDEFEEYLLVLMGPSTEQE